MVFTASSSLSSSRKPVMRREALSSQVDPSAGLAGSRWGERLAGVERVELDLVPGPDEPLSDGGKIGDLELPLLAAGQVDEVLAAVVAQMVEHRRRAEADEVAGADLVL